MGSVFRVLQAADLALHQPLEPAGVLPADLREIFNQARERATLKVFRKAISSAVDLLLLTGPLARFDDEPRLACFLFEQFRRLSAGGVRIVWAASSDEGLPDWATQETVWRLGPGESLSLSSLRSRRLMTVAWPTPGQAIPTGSPDHLAVTLQRSAQGLGIEYSINGEGGAARHRTIPIQPGGPDDQSPSGMWLTEAGPGSTPTSSLLATASVQWVSETVSIHAETTRAGILQEMEHRIAERHRRQSAELMLMQWRLTGQGPFWQSLLNDSHSRDLLQACRSLVETQRRIWSWKIDALPSDAQLELWRRGSQAFAQAWKIQEELTPADEAAASGAGLLPGHDAAHEIPSASQIHCLRMRLAGASQPPRTGNRNDFEAISLFSQE